MGIGIFVAIGSITALVALLFIPAVRVALEQVLRLFQEGFKWIYQTAPNAVRILIFLFLILFVVNTIMGGFLSINYDCIADGSNTNNGQLREINGGFIGGISYLIRGATINIGEADNFVCQGTPTVLCSTILTNTTCEQVGCSFTASVCIGTVNSCDYFSGNLALCGYVGCQNSSVSTTALDFQLNNTVPALQYTDDTPENLVTVSCVSNSPRLTIRGFDFLAYRNILILMMISGILWLMVGFRKLQSHR